MEPDKPVASHRLRSGNPRVDGKKLKLLRVTRNISQQQLADDLGVSTKSVSGWERGEQAISNNNAQLLIDFFGVSLQSICEAESYEGLDLPNSKYTIESALGDWLSASNGLRYRIFKLRHNELGRYARGKRFDLSQLATSQKDECRSLIHRHPDVAYQLSEHPNVIRSTDGFQDPVTDFFWVVDDWVEGPTLERVIKRGPIDVQEAFGILRGIASALTELHQHNIILRELSPATIIIRASDRQAILTEFELAKLLDYNATVSPGKWPESSGYRAIDATSDDVDHRADIYSWGRIATHMLLGRLPDSGSEMSELEKLDLPAQLLSFVSQTLSPLRDGRPDSFAELPVR